MANEFDPTAGGRPEVAARRPHATNRTDKFYTERALPRAARKCRWKLTASFVVEMGPHLAPVKTYRLRQCFGYGLVRYYAAHELRRLFVRVRT